ncbi:MAPEG family protein [Pseudaminobacter salicylatoxidans]|uniref:MAPEG family protein n=1 Tax=Pseudaminobacter salicylatoxidans TaxID=93369 RepID=A0A316CAC5_PSESE|nr:MAPEG family protein [Pseudaminobacter salicylatoxidans]PWJ86610.1 MAPEG family protein [Pseudaminobacter salicylatoxidans]
MEQYYGVAIVTLLCGLVLFGMAITVARTHSATGILAPRMTGDPRLEQAIRAHSNTLEWLPIFLPSMWLFAIYWSATWAAIFGGIWLVGRIAYFVGYLSAPLKRYPGFFIQSVATFILLLGALGRILFLWIS